MFNNYYIGAKPATIRSLILYGKLPDNLPSYIQETNIVCYADIKTAIANNGESFSQNFILEVNGNLLPFNKDTSKGSYPKCLEFQAINHNAIKKLFIYSETSQKLINKLFKGGCPVSIEKRPALFKTLLKQNIPNRKRKIVEVYTNKLSNNQCPVPVELAPKYFDPTLQQPVVLTKKARIEKQAPSKGVTQDRKNHQKTPAFFSPQANVLESRKCTYTPIAEEVIKRISTPIEHYRLLISVLNNAHDSVLITGLSINHRTLKERNLYKAMSFARARGVRIYLYYNDYKSISQTVLTFFERNGIMCDEAFTHSKILLADNTLVCIGSFNWLSTLYGKMYDSGEGTIVCSEQSICELMKEDIWNHIRQYRNIQYNNAKHVNRFNRNSWNRTILTYSSKTGVELSYIPTLDQHLEFLRKNIQQAQHKIIICSPFISRVRGYTQDITKTSLRQAVARGVKIFFVCSESDPKAEDFYAFLEEVNAETYLITEPGFHLKTIIIDDKTIVEGSFNWLSASRDSNSDYHNHEASVFVEGENAKPLIQHFYKSRIGQAVKAVERDITNYSQANTCYMPYNQQARRQVYNFEFEDFYDGYAWDDSEDSEDYEELYYKYNL